MKGFVKFIRQQGVMGLAVGFILGASVKTVVDSLVRDIINPLVGIALGTAGNLSDYVFVVGSAELRWGNFLAVLVDFAVIAAVVYFGVKWLKLDKLDKKKK